MKLSKSRLLLILLSFTVLIQNYNPVEASILGLGATAGIGCCVYKAFGWIPMCWKHTGYFFASVGYFFEVKITKYKKFSTSDDIEQGKYVNINLASVKHASYISVSEQPDDTVNKRKKLVLYEIKAHEHEEYPKHLTIGKVNFYCRKLQGNLKYHYRTVLTYEDEMGRKCIQIESFNQSGNRIMKRIYRERKHAWWYKMIIDEKETLIQSLNLLNIFKSGSSTNYTIDLFSLNLSEFISAVNFSHGNYYFINKTSKIGKITEILFANQPISPSDNIKDLLIWHYFTKENKTILTSFVVICEFNGDEWSCKYYKCVSPENREFKAYDSLSVPFDENLIFSENTISTRDLNKVKLDFNLKDKEVPNNIDKFALHLYPESNHYVLRPKDLNKVNLIDKVQAVDDGNSHILQHEMENGFRFISAKTYGDFYLISYTSLTPTNLLFNTISLKKKQQTSSEIFYESGTRALLDNFLSPYYMSLTVLERTTNTGSMVLDSTKQDGILSAKLNDNVTFYSVLYSQHKLFGKLKLESKVFDLPLDINSQMFYFESSNSRFALVTHVNKEPTILKYDGTEFKLGKINEMQNELSNSKLTDILSFKPETKWVNIDLNLNDVYISEDIEILVPTSNTAVFRTSYGKRISKILWNENVVNIKEGWPLISKIMYMEHCFLLVDTVRQKKIHRELYKLSTNAKPVLMANKSIDISSKNLDHLAKELSDSIHDLYPNNLPAKVYFEDAKTEISKFGIDDLTIAHSNYDLVFTPGDITVHGNDCEVLENHKWRQVFKYKGPEKSDFYSIFTLTREGMCYFFKSPKDEKKEKFLREKFKEINNNTIPLLVDSIYLNDVKTENISVGKNRVQKFKSKNNGKVLNPIVFGRHEIRLLGKIKKVEVFKSFDENNLCSFSIEAQFEDNTNGSLTFTQISANSDKFKIKDQSTIEFDDELVDIFEHAKEQSDQNELNFNKSKYPLDLRYMILNDVYFYFTGYTKKENFSIKFGKETYNIAKKNTRYNIWVRYPYGNVTTCGFFMSYRNGNKLHTKSQVHDNENSEYKIEKPKVSFNWGILSNLEAKVVNRYLLGMASHVEEMFPLDLKIGDTNSSNGIMKLKIDEKTLVYTTVSSSKCVINNIIFKNTVIKGVPKQLAKQVFYSKVGDENVIVVLTKTVSKVMVNGYVLKEDTFHIVDVNKIDCNKHNGLKRFNLCG